MSQVYSLAKFVSVPYCNEDGVCPEEEHEDDDDEVLGGDIWLWHSSLAEGRVGWGGGH